MGGANLALLLDGPTRWAADRPAVLVGDRPVRTWAELGDAVARRASSLRDRFGIRSGDRVALFSANHEAYLEAMFSIWHAGAVAVPISSRLHPREVEGIVEDSRPRVCFASPDGAEALADRLDGVSVVVLGGSEDDALLAAEPVQPQHRASSDDAWIFFTSGTTGRPKGARLTHSNLLAMTGAYMADVAEVTPRDSIVHVAALSHASGLFSLPFIARGAPQVLPASGRFDPYELFDLIAAGERSTFFVPPTLLRRLTADAGSGSVDAARLGTIIVGAEPVRPADLRAGVEAFGPCLWNGYGQGESPCTITAHGKRAIATAIEAGDEEGLGSVGVARAWTRVRAVDEGDRELGPGEVGEVIVDGPTVMAGYLNRPEATAETLRGRWLHTGDLGRFDERGRLTLVGRAKDVIVTGGENVYAREVEDVLEAHPMVSEAAVVGRPDPDWGERVVAFVVTVGGSEVSEEDLDRRCVEAIARHKRPREYHFVADLPRNASGKVLKREISAEIDAAR